MGDRQGAADTLKVRIRDRSAGTAAPRPFSMRWPVRAAMVASGFLPLLHAAAVIAATMAAVRASLGGYSLLAGALVLYVLPPVAVRLLLARRPLATGESDPESPDFLRWWLTAQCQILFLRLPVLEELLRVVPGLYSMWLRLWGARVGALVYWSPGVCILDRPLVRVGHRVVFGVGVRINPHVLARPSGGGPAVLHLAPVAIGNDVIVGGYSLLLPGCVIGDGEITPPHRSIHPYSTFAGGRRVSIGRRASMDGGEDG
jgi:acetyltransferase-like isoleucine patch superfamily enzyme